MNIEINQPKQPLQNNHTLEKAKPSSFPLVQQIFCQPTSSSRPLSSRVKVRRKAGYTKTFWQFINIYQPMMSTDVPKINAFLAQIKNGDYSFVADPECPYWALAAFARNALTILDIANILSMSQLTKESQAQGSFIIVGQLLDQHGRWTQEALKHCIEPFFNSSDISRKRFANKNDETLRKRVKILPRYQRIFFLNPNRYTPDEFDHRMSFQVSQLANECFFGHRFGMEPRLGIFDPNHIVEGIVKKRSRLCHIPFPDIPSPKRIHGRYVSPLEVCGHDRTHVEVNHLYSTMLIGGIVELLVHFQQVSKMKLSKEIWELGDMVAFQLIENLQKGKMPSSPSEELNQFFKSENNTPYSFKDLFSSNSQVNFFGWVSLLYMKEHEIRWRWTHGIQLKKVSILSKKREFLERAEPYLLKNSLIEKIIKLQLLENEDPCEQIASLEKLKCKKITYSIIKVKPRKYHNHVQLANIQYFPR